MGHGWTCVFSPTLELVPWKIMMVLEWLQYCATCSDKTGEYKRPPNQVGRVWLWMSTFARFYPLFERLLPFLRCFTPQESLFLLHQMMIPPKYSKNSELSTRYIYGTPQAFAKQQKIFGAGRTAYSVNSIVKSTEKPGASGIGTGPSGCWSLPPILLGKKGDGMSTRNQQLDHGIPGLVNVYITKYGKIHHAINGKIMENPLYINGDVQ